MIMKRSDIKNILEVLMQTEFDDADFQLDELAISAICELMNQMMGASATALSDFLGEPINISTPRAFEIHDSEEFKEEYFKQTEPLVVVRFNLKIGEHSDSEFMTVLTIPLARNIIKSLGLGDIDEGLSSPPPPAESAGGLSQAQIDSMTAPAPAPAAAPAAAAPAAAPAQAPPAQAYAPPQEYAQPPPGYPPPGYPPPGYPPPGYPPAYAPPQAYADPRVINVQPMKTNFSAVKGLADSEADNLNLIMTVPLQVSVEIGRTKKQVKEIMDFSQGTLVVLDKLAGDQADIYVNGQPFAKGDIVVIDDSFGVKITEIVGGDIKLSGK